jgi:glycosyltransferase involved in cell wall biosynthesis
VANGRRYFPAFDVFALSSDHEPFGMVLLEAMAAGVPVIGTDCGGGREVIEGVGGLFPLGNAAALAETLVRQAQIQDLRTLHQEMLARLQQCFSDQAVRQRFWALPLLAELS